MSDRWSDDVAAYALGALGGRERAELEEHLASCAECRAAADDAAWTVRALDRVPPSAVGGLAGTGREGHRRRDDGDAS
ncbi:zf-HC2 domain-containing protein, partial [Actinotalea sp. AC32]|nr:zf-HC2 domain-containing protein [Actinotalea sp. AC32]